VATITPSGPLPPDFDNITAFWEDGITTSSHPTQGTAYGLWKKVGPRTYATKIVQVNADGTLTTIESTSDVIGDKMTAPFQGKVTDLTGKTVLAQSQEPWWIIASPSIRRPDFSYWRLSGLRPSFSRASRTCRMC
jgi:hypothetical protein